MLGAALALGVPLEKSARVLAAVPHVKGRVEVVPTPGKDYTVLIDYSHTPDSLENILRTVKGFAKGRTVALFGCGDETMADTFCDGVAELMKYVEPTGARIIGSFDVSGYDFSESKAVGADGKAVGLLIDEVNHADTADRRISEWCELLKTEI